MTSAARKVMLMPAVPATRERLIRAGVFFFQNQGYHGTGISEILQHAAAPKGSFYHHFPDGKEQLAVAALDWLENEVTRYLDDLLVRQESSETMVRGIARYAAEGARSKQRRRGSLLAALAQDAAGDSTSIARALQKYTQAVCERLAEARKRERPRENGQEFAVQALAMIQGAVILARVANDPGRILAIVNSWLNSTR